MKVVRAWDDGPTTFLHTLLPGDDGSPARVGTEFLLAGEDQTIVKRWAVHSEWRGPNPSGRTQIDGPTEVADLEHTEANKALVRKMLEDCLFPGARATRIEDYFADDYRQHNPNVPDGLAIVRELAQSGTRDLVYQELVLLVGKGNFVATLCKVDNGGEVFDQVDILRIEGGRIVEHWDNY